MTRRQTIPHLLITLALIMTVAGSSSAISGVVTTSVFVLQDTTQQPPEPLIRRQGWGIPGLRGSSILTRRSPANSQGVGVTTRKVRGLVLTPNPFEPKVFMDVTEILEYDSNGRTFAYLVSFAYAIPVQVTPNTPYTYRVGDRYFTVAGASGGIWYYDMNGNGTFETAEWMAQDPANPVVPAWAKR